MMRLHLTLAATILAGAAGCDAASSAAETSATGALDETLDSNDVGAHESGLLVTAATTRTNATVLDDIIERARLQLPARFSPAGCAVTTRNAGELSITFADCAGPYGLLKTTGTVTLDYAIAAGTVSIVASGKGLAVNASRLDLDATATFAAADKTLEVTTRSSGTGEHGSDVTRAGTYSVTWDDTCSTVNGSWTSRIGAVAWDTDVADYYRCPGMCAARGTITNTRASNEYSVDITFDGTSDASFKVSTGAKGNISLNCE